MQKMIPVDKLARPDDRIMISRERVLQARIDQGLPLASALPGEEDFLKFRLHGIAAGEMQAMEAAGRTLFDFPDAPWEFQLDMARQVWDESRHLEIFTKLLEYVGSYLGEFPESEVLWSCTQADDPAARVAGINRGLEGLACDVFEQIIRLAQRMGDPVIERLQRALDFQANIDNLFNFQGGRTTREASPQVAFPLGDKQINFDATITIAREARLLAGFTDEEIDRLYRAAARSTAY